MFLKFTALLLVGQIALSQAAQIRFAPYVDITLNGPTLADLAKKTGVKHYTLAFALGSSLGCEPSWGGILPLNEPRIINQINELRALGGDVIIASGGALGPYLEHVCGGVDALVAAYEKVLDATGSNHLDLDIEATVNMDVVSKALAKLQQKRDTVIGFTLMIQGDDYGLTPFLGVNILEAAVKNNVRVDLVNAMLMNYGSTQSTWGDSMVLASESVLKQMKQVWPNKSDAELRKMYGATPMLGRNDTGPICRQVDAKRLIEWANQNHIGFVSFWSASRDNGSCSSGGVRPTCSGIAQSDFEFTNIFKGFTG